MVLPSRLAGAGYLLLVALLCPAQCFCVCVFVAGFMGLPLVGFPELGLVLGEGLRPPWHHAGPPHPGLAWRGQVGAAAWGGR